MKDNKTKTENCVEPMESTEGRVITVPDKIDSHCSPSEDSRSDFSTRTNPILFETQNFLNELENAELTFPQVTINIIKRLKEIERTGKSIRLSAFKSDGIKIRSIYDHIVSVAYLADSLVKFDNGNLINESDYSTLGRLIAYHEINEVLLGDVPVYTDSQELGTPYLNEDKFKDIDRLKRETVANSFMWLYMNKKQQSSIEELNRNLYQQNTGVMKFFLMLDRIDPIISVWRYLHFYRESSVMVEKDFINIMRDFFVNPKVLSYRTKKMRKMFPYIQILLENLINTDNARKYLRGTELDKLVSDKTTRDIMIYLIEKTPLFIS